MIIGEAGAGQGYFTFPLTRRMGRKGKVYAVGKSKSILEVIQSRSKRINATNIKSVLGETEDPLPPQKNREMIVIVLLLFSICYATIATRSGVLSVSQLSNQ
jgi:precorrin-6B methylase 2